MHGNQNFIVMILMESKFTGIAHPYRRHTYQGNHKCTFVGVYVHACMHGLTVLANAITAPWPTLYLHNLIGFD